METWSLKQAAGHIGYMCTRISGCWTYSMPQKVRIWRYAETVSSHTFCHLVQWLRERLLEPLSDLMDTLTDCLCLGIAFQTWHVGE
jgi:hypothetical protein